MKNYGGGMGGGFPMSFFMPMFNDPAPVRDSNPVPDIVVPARINKAMEFLSLINIKTQKRVAANDMSIQEIDGEKLCAEEENARDAALNCLASYFDGKLKPDIWEEARYEAIRKQLATNGKEGTLCRCFGCPTTYPNPGCPLCKGKGKLFVQGVGDDEVSYLAQIAVMKDDKFFNPDAALDETKGYGDAPLNGGEQPPQTPPNDPKKKPKKPKNPPSGFPGDAESGGK